MKKWPQAFLFYFILGTAVFYNSFNHPFLIDDLALLHNPVLSQPKYIWSQWDPYQQQSALDFADSRNHLLYYRPLTHMVYDLMYPAFKRDYWKYHVLNLLLLVMCSTLMFALICSVSGRSKLAFLSGLLFLVHPINGILVNYISANVFTLQVICMLGAMFCLWEFLVNRGNACFYGLGLVLAFLSLFWHETGAMLVFYVLAMFALLRPGLIKRNWVAFLPLVVMELVYGAFRLAYLHVFIPSSNAVEHMFLAPGVYLANLFNVLTWHLGKLFCPQGIVMHWAAPLQLDHLLLHWIGFFLLGAVIVVLLALYSKDRLLQMALVWFLIGLAPVCLAMLRIRNGIEMEPHWMVFGNIGFFILTAHGCAKAWEKFKTAGPVLVIVLVMVWAGLSHVYNRLWSDQKTYAFYWMRHAPYVKLAYYFLAESYKDEGALHVSEHYYKLALSDPQASLNERIYNNLEAMAAKEGRFKEALSDINMALMVNPHSALSYYNRGVLDFERGQWEDARADLQRSLQLDPLFLKPRLGLATICLKKHEYQKALDLCRENLNTDPADGDTILLMLSIFAYQKDGAGLTAYARQLIHQSFSPPVLMTLGGMMERAGLDGLALESYRKILLIAPEDKGVYGALVSLLRRNGRKDEAMKMEQIQAR